MAILPKEPDWLYREVDRLNNQILLVRQKLEDLNTKVTVTAAQVTQSFQPNTGVTNLLLNTDFTFSEQAYRSFADDNACAHAYRLPISSTIQITENSSTTVSPNALTTTSTPSFWDKPAGLLVWTGDDAILLPLPKNYASAGRSFFFRFSLRLQNLAATETNPIAPLPAGSRLRVSFWVNSNPSHHLRGQSISGTSATPTGPSGTNSRDYIIVATYPGGTRRSSAIFGTGNTLGFDTSFSSQNFVDVAWELNTGAVNVYVFRRANAGTWSHLVTLPGNFTTFRDQGDQQPLPTVPQPATSETEVARFLTNLAFTDPNTPADVVGRIRVPFSTVFPADKEFVRFELVDSQENPISLGTGQLVLDRVLLATGAGTWTPAAQDLNAVGAVSSNNPFPDPPPGPPPDGPGAGGGFIL